MNCIYFLYCCICIMMRIQKVKGSRGMTNSIVAGEWINEGNDIQINGDVWMSGSGGVWKSQKSNPNGKQKNRKGKRSCGGFENIFFWYSLIMCFISIGYLIPIQMKYKCKSILEPRLLELLWMWKYIAILHAIPSAHREIVYLFEL